MTQQEFILEIVKIIVILLTGAGGIFALVKTILKINKQAKKYEVRCKMAAEMIKAGIVKIEPEAAKDLLLKVLEDKFDEIDKQKVNNIIKQGKQNLKGVK